MRRTLCAILFLTLLACNMAGAATKYVMKDLGKLPGDDESNVEAINNKGQIVGTSWKSSDKKGWVVNNVRSFLWENGRMTEVKAPVGDKGVCLMDINDSGVMMVSGWDDSFIVDKGTPTKIPPLPGKKSIRGLEINNRGDVLANGSEGKGMQPVFHRAGVSKLIETPAGYLSMHSGTMNHKGQVAVTIEKAGYSTSTALWEDGKMRILEGVPDDFDVCALSDDGAIAGMRDTGDEVKGCVWRNGAIKYLRTPEGLYDPWPESINKHGAVVGMCMTDEAATYAVVWDKDGVPTELPILDAFESEAKDINDAGVIVGTVYDEDGKSKAVMWTPVK